MPPKRSSRLRNPSAQAVAIAAEGEPPQRKSRRAAVQPTPDTLGPSSVISTDQTVPIPHAASGTPQPASLPPGVLDQLATRVADEVSFSPGGYQQHLHTQCSVRSAAVFHLICTSQYCLGAWHINCNSRVGGRHSRGIFKHHTKSTLR